MLPACVGRIPALLIQLFPTHAGIFYHEFHFFWHICILQEYFLHIFRISYTCRKHVSGTFEKCVSFFYLGVAQLEKLFSYLNENMHICYNNIQSAYNYSGFASLPHNLFLTPISSHTFFNAYIAKDVQIALY